MNVEFFVSDGISGGRSFATYRRKPNGSLKRVVSKHLPVRASREEAQADLDAWLASRAYVASKQDGGSPLPVYYAREEVKP